MLQTNPLVRPNCDQILSNETVIKRISAIREGKEILNERQPIELLNTIKLPRNMNEINQRLPKKKRYREEMEEANLMSYDINISKKPKEVINDNFNKNNPQIINAPTDNKENNMKKNKELDYIKNYIEISNNPQMNKPSTPNKIVQQVYTPIVNKDNNVRPSSAASNNSGKNQNVLNNAQQNIIISGNNNKNPVIIKNEMNMPNSKVVPNEKERIILNDYNKLNIKPSNNPIKPSNNPNIYNNVLQNKPKIVDNKPVLSRPQSAKLGGNEKNVNNLILRKNNSEQRPSSPGKILMPNKKIVINNSPRNKSPIKEKPININPPVMRPNSGRDRIQNQVYNNIALNKPVLVRNDKKVVIEKVNYEKGSIPSKKPNYHYINPPKEQILVNNRNNLVNAMKVNEHHLLNRPSSNQGPKIVYINQRK